MYCVHWNFQFPALNLHTNWFFSCWNVASIFLKIFTWIVRTQVFQPSCFDSYYSYHSLDKIELYYEQNKQQQLLLLLQFFKIATVFPFSSFFSPFCNFLSIVDILVIIVTFVIIVVTVAVVIHSNRNQLYWNCSHVSWQFAASLSDCCAIGKSC